MKPHSSIYASTACLGGAQPLTDRLRLYRELGMEAVELGDKVTIEGACTSQLLGPGPYLLHNYFPPPPEPFVLNLASVDARIRERSMALVRRALSLSAALGAPLYSVHAGFVTDPTLAFIFPKPDRPDAGQEALRRFVESIRGLLPFAERAGVRLLVENNVCERHNMGTLLLQTTDEFQEFFGMIASPFLGILVDTGHLNVSAATYGFNRMEFIAVLAPYIGAFHLHDNDGSADQHRPVEEGSWITGVLRTPALQSLPWIMEAKFPNGEALLAQRRFLETL
ncbi:MAG: sugar phosphate isomerase/epimerase family protein [Patescibacteria group bacterium]